MIEIEACEIFESENSEWKKRYQEVLASTRWQVLKEMVSRRADWKCERCGRTDSLQLHHLTYRNLGAESPKELLLLCEKCHSVADRYREIQNFGYWLNGKEGKAALWSHVYPPGLDPLYSGLLADSVRELGGKIKLSWRNAKNGSRIIGSGEISIELFGVSILVLEDASKHRANFPLRGKFDELLEDWFGGRENTKGNPEPRVT